MKIDCYFSMGCTSDVLLKKNLLQALAAEGIEAEVGYHRITDDEAENLGLKGSPTILIDGVDPFPSDIDGFSWRVYENESGRLANAPSVKALREVINGVVP